MTPTCQGEQLKEHHVPELRRAVAGTSPLNPQPQTPVELKPSTPKLVSLNLSAPPLLPPPATKAADSAPRLVRLCAEPVGQSLTVLSQLFALGELGFGFSLGLRV